ncbi:MAG: chemotaxis-specific protein-glutamate methyltransferase CheB [Anaerolineae bacterium]|nr:chemotaxis-specific protein-glutamate methyltransferase CheB [Anaerolineae bacterium]
MQKKREKIRVVVIDDSPTARELLVALFQADEEMEVVGTGGNGEDAIRLVSRLRPDVVTMDISMPKVDGLEATRRIMREIPTPIVVVTASLMRKDVDMAFESLRAGALTAVKKPGLMDPETCERLVKSVKAMARVSVVRRWDPAHPRPAQPAVSSASAAVDISPETQQQVQMIGIAASTGGPGVLAKLLRPLPADFPIPILIVQHVTDGFATGLAEWLNGETALRVALASHGDRPQAGSVLMPPDDYHMQVNVRRVIELYKGQPYKGLRPSANYLFHSLARAYGASAVGIILTGMGDDGVDGLKALHQAGGLTIAQDEESCIVYGMPKEAVANRAVGRILSPDHIAFILAQLAKRGEEKSYG